MHHFPIIELLENVDERGPRCSLRAQAGVTRCGHIGFQVIAEGRVVAYVCKAGETTY
jgi:hypothetical protein